MIKRYGYHSNRIIILAVAFQAGAWINLFFLPHDGKMNRFAVPAPTRFGLRHLGIYQKRLKVGAENPRMKSAKVASTPSMSAHWPVNSWKDFAQGRAFARQLFAKYHET